MFYFFKKRSVQATMTKCFIDSAVDRKLAETIVYSSGISPFYKKIIKLGDKLTNQQSAVIASIIMASSYINEVNKLTDGVGSDNLPLDKQINAYELIRSKRYLEQVLILLLKDSNDGWQTIAEAYVRAYYYFCSDKSIDVEILNREINDLNPNNSEIDLDFIEEIQRDIDRKSNRS